MKQSASLIYFVPMILFGLLFHKKGMTSGTLETEKERRRGGSCLESLVAFVFGGCKFNCR
jgi:hypothetical protein